MKVIVRMAQLGEAQLQKSSYRLQETFLKSSSLYGGSSLPIRQFSKPPDPFTSKLQEIKASMRVSEEDLSAKSAPLQAKSNLFEEQPFEHRQSHEFRAEYVYSMDLEQVLQVFKSAAQDKHNSPHLYSFYHACLDRINSIVLERDSELGSGKDGVLKVLRALSHFRPKEMQEREKKRKQAGHYYKHERQDDFVSVKHKQIMQEKGSKFQTVAGNMGSFVYQNLTKGFFKDMFTQFDEEQRSKTAHSLADVYGEYLALYQNLEVRVNDMFSSGIFAPKDCLDILISFSVAQEGTNTLYLRIVEHMIPLNSERRAEEFEYSMVEIEMILNYFPHSIWTSEPSLGTVRSSFYGPILEKVEQNIDKVEDRQFLSLFQGLTLTGQSVFLPSLLNGFMNEFLQRVKREQQMEPDRVLAFLEIFVQFLGANPSLQDIVDATSLMSLLNGEFVKGRAEKMSMHELSGFYWVYYSLGSLWEEKVVDLMEERITQLLREEIILQKQLDKADSQILEKVTEGLQTMELADLEVLEHYYSGDSLLLEASKKHKEIQKLIKQARYWNKPENERKWFHF